MDQLTEFAQIIPALKNILGIKEGGSSITPIQLQDKNGNPLTMDLDQLINIRRFEAEERRADERHNALMDLAKSGKENLPDFV